MRSCGKHSTVLCLVAFLLLASGVHHVIASSSAYEAAIKPGLSSALTPLVENFPGVAKVVRMDDRALFIPEEDFIWAVTDVSASGITMHSTNKILEVVAEMRPGDYIVSPYWKAREIQHIEIREGTVYLETIDLEYPAGADDGKGQYVGQASYPFDIPILDLQDQVLIDSVVDGVPVTITANNLYIEMSGDLIFGYNFDLIPPDIIYLLMEFDSNLAVTIDYTAMVGGAIDHHFDLLTFDIPVYTVGFATIDVHVGLPTQLTTDGPVCIGGGLSFNFGYSVGFEALSGDVTPIWTTAPGNFTELDPSYGAEANANLKTTVDLGVAASVGIAGVLDVADLTFDLGVYANTVGVMTPSCSWSLDSGVTADLAFVEFTGLICGPGDCDWTLFDASIYSDNESCDSLTDNCACNAQVCPAGCCNGNQCQSGATDEACGSAGEACVTCGSDQHCVGGICVAACDTILCPDGCCDGTTCQPGDTDAQCGTGGAACAPCADNQQCEGQECRELCDSNLCPAGCCSGKQCEPGDTNEYCGVGGVVCEKCKTGTHCDAGVCAADVDDDVVDDDTIDDDTIDDDAADDDAADDDATDDDTSATDDDTSPAADDDSSHSSGGCGC